MRWLLCLLLLLVPAVALAGTKEDEAAKAAVAVELELLKLKSKKPVVGKWETSGYAVSAKIVQGKYDKELELIYHKGGSIERSLRMQAGNCYGSFPGDPELSGWHTATEIVEYVRTHKDARFEVSFGYVWHVKFFADEPKKETLVIGGKLHEKGPDGYYREVQGASGVAPKGNFQQSSGGCGCSSDRNCGAAFCKSKGGTGCPQSCPVKK